MQQPDCTRLHGWFLESAEDLAFRKTLIAIHDTSFAFERVPNLPDTLHLFTDGSGTDPNHPHLRIATWGVCVAALPEMEFPPVAAGGIPGLLQTVLRAEITAVTTAIHYGIHSNRPFYIWTDCQVVFDRVLTFVKDDTSVITPKQKGPWPVANHAIRTCCQPQDGPVFRRSWKSHHTRIAWNTHSFVDRWAIKGNEAADALAIWARQLLPPEVTQAHQRLKLASQVRYKACQALHRLLVDIGSKVTSEKEELKAKEESAWDAMQSQQPQVVEKVSFAQLPVDLIEPAEHALGEGFSDYLHVAPDSHQRNRGHSNVAVQLPALCTFPTAH